MLLSAFCGLLQVWLQLATNAALQGSPPIMARIVLDGAFLFFSTTLVAALTLDYFFSKAAGYSKPVVGFLFVFFPAVILLASVWLFGLCFGKPDLVDLNIVAPLEYAVLTMTGVYAIVVKTLQFRMSSS